MLQDMLPCKTTFTLKTIPVKAANTSQPGAHGILVHIHIKSIADYHGNAGALRYV